MENNGFIALGILAVVILFFGIRSFDDQGQFNPLRAPAPQSVETASGGRAEVVLSAQRNGHFLLEGTIGGRRTQMMVDSGASIVTLRESDAAKAGIRPAKSDYRFPFSSANGEGLAARAVLPSLEIGDVVLRDLEVSVLPDDKLSVSLFGVNGLNRFDGRTVDRDRLVLYTN